MTPEPNHNGNNGNNGEYSAQNIRVLDGLEAVRMRPGMYIGDTGKDGLHHLVYEIVYNSIDEAMAGYCDRIQVIINADNSVTVIDNGRGIPVDIHPEKGVSALEVVMTTLHAGGKFGDGAYSVSSGLHGVGASVVSALSKWLRAEVRREGKVWRQDYKVGVRQDDVKVVGKTTETGTLITFMADDEIFGEVNFDFNVLAERIRELAFLNKGVAISLRDERTDSDVAYFFEGGIASLVRRINKNRQVLDKSIYIAGAVNSTAVEVAIQYNDGYSENVTAFANCVNTKEGGTHMTGFRAALTRVLNDYARKSKFLKDNDPNLSGDDVRDGLTAVVSVKVGSPQFEGQTKAKLGNPEVKGQVESVTSDGLNEYLEKHPEEGKSIIDKCLLAAKAREAARKARDLILKKTGLEFGTLPGKLADCSSNNPKDCELYLVEGDSAGGSAKQGRDRNFQAILPLRGKILNVEKAAKDKIFDHEEIRNLITALGTGIGEAYDYNKLRYHQIIIMTDADVDGAHIRTLLLTFFYRNMADLIQNGHLFIAQPPLYRLASGKQQHWVYSDAEKDEKLKGMKSSKVDVQRYKGLGEMSPQQLWETTMNPATRTLLKVQVDDAMKADEIFHILMGSEVPPRKSFIQAHARSVKNLDI
jgi:DNA gyrase subunit B